MITLNRKSAVYQSLFNNAMTRLNRVPKELLEPLTEPKPDYAAIVAPYIFEREELEHKINRQGPALGQTVDFADYFCPRITQNQAIAYGRHHVTYFQLPIKCHFGGEVLASLMWIVFARSTDGPLPFDLRAAAHRAVVIYISGLVRRFNIGRTKPTDAYFTHRSAIGRNNAIVANLLNQDDLSALESLLENKVHGLVDNDLETDSDTFTVRFPTQITGNTNKGGQPFYQFPYSFIDYRDAIDNVVDGIFLIHETTGAGEADHALVSSKNETVGSPTEIIRQVRNACFTHWLEADQVSPKICRELAEELLADYRGYFAAAFRVENDALLDFSV